MKVEKYLLVTLLSVFFLTGAVLTNASPANYWDENSTSLDNFSELKKSKINTINFSLAPGDPVDLDAALFAGADYLRKMQADITEDNAGNGNPDVPDDPDDGGWDWSSTTFSHSTGASPTNTYGATAMGVYYAYLETGDAALFTVLQDVADHIVSTGPSINRSGADMKFLLFFNVLYSAEVAPTTVYADAAKAKYDGRITTYGSATALAEAIRDFRAPSYPNGIIGWDIGIYSVVSQMLFDIYGGTYDVDADDIAEVLWQDSYNSNPGYFDIIADQGFDPTYSDVNFYWYNLGITGLIDAFSASGSHTSEIPALVNILLEGQHSGGAIGFSYGVNTDDEDWQSTGYAMMTLGNLDQATYQNDLNRMGYWLGATQDVSGGWTYSGTFWTETIGEATAGLYFTTNDNADVLVDGSFTSQADVDVYNATNSTSYVWGYSAFATIQEAVDAVNGSTINIAAGTHVEPAQVIINKDLTIRGAGKTLTTLMAGFNTTVGYYLTTDAFIYITPGVTVTIEDLSIDGTGQVMRHAIQSRATAVTVRNCDISNVYANIYAGRGIVYLSGTGLVENCTMSNIQRIGVHIRGGVEPTAPNVDVIDFTYVGKGVGDFLDYGVEFGGGGTGTVQNSSITNCYGVASVDTSGSAGILATDYYGTGTDATITGCTISNNSIGIYAGYTAGDATTLTANYNDLSGNDMGLFSVTATPPNAESNYWGVVSASGVAASVDGAVDFDPWCTDASHTNCTLTSLVSESFVDDDWVGTPDGTDLGGGMIFGYNAFATVQAGIDAVNGSTVYVAGGTYVLPAQLVINKDINLLGAGAGVTIFEPGYNTSVGYYLVSDALVYVDYGVTALIEDITIDGTGFTVRHGIQSRGANLTVRNCDIRDIYANIYAGRGIVYLSGTGLVENCTMSNIQRIGVHIRGGVEPTAPNVDVIDFTYVGKGVGDFLDYGVEFGGGGTGTVQNSSITNCYGVASSDGSGSAGILATDYYGTGTAATITGCTISNNSIGIYAGYTAGDLTVVVAQQNDLSGNDMGLFSVAAGTLNASENWWGDADPSDDVDGDISYNPYWTANYVGDNHTTPWTWGVDNSGTIQAAIDAASAGDFINLAAGIYAEGPQIHVDKSLALVGQGAVTITPTANTGNTGDPRGWFLVDPSVLLDFSNVTLDGAGFDIYQAVRSRGGGTYENMVFTNITYPGYGGVALAIFSDENVTINNCVFTNIGRIGALLFGAGLTNSYFTNNTYTGKGDGDWLDYAADISAGAVVTVDNCTITNCTGVASSDGSTSAGLLVSTYFGLGTTVTITNSSITGNTVGINVGYDAADESVVTAHNNLIADNTSEGISTSGPLVSVSAENNFWGTFDGPLDASGTSEAVIGGDCYTVADITNQVAEGFPVDGLGNAVGDGVSYCPWVASDLLMTPDDIVYLCSGSFDVDVTLSPSIANMKSISVRLSYPAGLVFGALTLADANYANAPIFVWDNAVGYDSVQVDMFVQSGYADGFADLFTVSFNGTADLCTGDLISMTKVVWKAGTSNDEIIAVNASPLTISSDCANPVVTINSPVDGGFYNTIPILDISTSDNCSIDSLYYQVDADGWIAILSDYAGNSYSDATWQLTTLDFDNLTEASHCIQFRVVDDFGREGLSASWCFTKDVTAPASPIDLVAEPGHNKVKLNWTSSTSSDVIGVQIQRNAWGDYPTYDTPAPAYPTAYNIGTNVFDGIGSSTTDELDLNNSTRDIYYYTIFAYDAAGNYSVVVPVAQARATSYWLGDVADNTFSLGNYDGFVHIGDLTVFATTYWKAVGDVGFINEADFGPTVVGTDNGALNSARGIPLPDDSISFTDLGIFAINYKSVDNVMKAVPVFADLSVNGSLNLTLEPLVEDNKITCNLNLKNNTDGAKIIHVVFEYSGNLVFDGYENKIGAEVNGYPIFAKSRTAGNLIEFDMALLGQGASISGSGTLASFNFTVVDNNEVNFNFIEGFVFDNNMEELSSELLTGRMEALPIAYILEQNYPNPFNPTTEISYQLPKPGKVTLEVFNLLGQKVITLVNGEQEASSYTVSWDGRNESGVKVTSGVYLYRLNTNDFVQTRKMILLK